MKRLLDIIVASIALLILLPFMLIIFFCIVLESKGGLFYKQQRVGKNNKPFYLYKFRSMKKNADKKGLLTVGGKDPRVTRIGYFLRKSKMDELPQLINIIKGDMSIVGPRPEVPKYVALYDENQRRVLSVRPGLTDLASIKYINESELLENAENPEEFYIQKIMPDKLHLNLEYIDNKAFAKDFRIVFQTLIRLFDRKK
jgi:lipopolysaccharide/colanic/teichoic acid biosynthesis glycosyltransferase